MSKRKTKPRKRTPTTKRVTSKPRNPELAAALGNAAEVTDREGFLAAYPRAAECLQRHMASCPPPADSPLWHLRDGLGMGLALDSFRQQLRKWADFFSVPRPSVQHERAAKAAAYIRERFRDTGKPVSAYFIARHLRVGRKTVTSHVFPLLHHDKSLVCVGRGPAAGWTPRD